MKAWLRYGILLPLLALAWPLHAVAQDAEATGATVSATSGGAAAAQTPEKKFNFVVMPIPVSNPAIGNGLALVAMGLYTPGHSPRPWTSGIGGVYTDSKSWGGAIFQRAYLNDGKFRLVAALGTGDFNLKFFGIGSDAGASGRSVDIEQESDFAGGEFLFRMGHGFYGGIMYRGMKMKTTFKASEIDLPIPIPDIERDSTVSQLGLAGEYDTRDTEYGPRKGMYGTLQWLYASDAFGSDFDYPRVAIALNGYHALSDKAVLAWRGSLCYTGDGAPFYDLCSYGQNNDLRGYLAGQYRDHAMFAVQAEYRRNLYKRWGMVAFAGLGKVAPDFGSFGNEKLLPAAGLGLRFLASEKYRVNVSVDYAVGDDSNAFYFYVGEAF